MIIGWPHGAPEGPTTPIVGRALVRYKHPTVPQPHLRVTTNGTCARRRPRSVFDVMGPAHGEGKNRGGLAHKRLLRYPLD